MALNALEGLPTYTEKPYSAEHGMVYPHPESLILRICRVGRAIPIGKSVRLRRKGASKCNCSLWFSDGISMGISNGAYSILKFRELFAFAFITPSAHLELSSLRFDVSVLDSVIRQIGL